MSMAGDEQHISGETFSSTVGLLYVFNLIVGTGALALPRAFQLAGYVLGPVLLLISAFTSYICVTFVLESMAIANCVLRRRKFAFDHFSIDEQRAADGTADDEHQAEIAHAYCVNATYGNDVNFAITRRVELSEMAHIFLGKTGIIFAYIVLAVYLFGDLAVYSATVPKSLMNVICSSLSNASAANYTGPCHITQTHLLHNLSRFVVYRLCIILFIVFCLPMILVGMTKTKWLQLATTFTRWIAFVMMTIIASFQLTTSGPKGSPPAMDMHGFGSLFGVTVYAFMCHHSVPGLVTPIRNKGHLGAKLVFVYVLIFLFYCALSMSGSFAFEHVQDIYTINFLHDEQTGGLLNAVSDYFLALFPVFVLTSSYVIVAITLSNNIRVFFSLVSGKELTEQSDVQQQLPNSPRPEEREALLAEEQSSSIAAEELPSINFHSNSSGLSSPVGPLHGPVRSPLEYLLGLAIPLIVVFIPGLLAFFTDNVLLLASITGSFPGVAVQYVLPALLILGARRTLSFRVGYSASLPSNLRSPFAHWLWPFVILCWAGFAMVVVTANIFHLG